MKSRLSKLLCAILSVIFALTATFIMAPVEGHANSAPRKRVGDKGAAHKGATPKGTTTAADFRIVPGHSLGHVWIGATHTTVRRLWGRPYLIRRGGKHLMEFWHVGNKDAGHYKAAVFARKRVVQLETDSPRFVTAQGIRTGSTLAAIRRRFKSLRLISRGINSPDRDVAEHATHYYAAMRHGITFDLGMGYRPDLSDANVSHRLLIHRRGHAPLFVHGTEVWSEPSTPKQR